MTQFQALWKSFLEPQNGSDKSHKTFCLTTLSMSLAGSLKSLFNILMCHKIEELVILCLNIDRWKFVM